MTKTFFYKKESQNLIILQEEEWKWKKIRPSFFSEHEIWKKKW